VRRDLDPLRLAPGASWPVAEAQVAQADLVDTCSRRSTFARA